MSAHTPGPWTFGKRGKYRQSIDAPDWCAFCKVVVRMDYDDCDHEIGLANARLIAAAPDLLEAAIRVRDSNRTNVTGEAAVQARHDLYAAIAKAVQS